jgi:hypothetical protein
MPKELIHSEIAETLLKAKNTTFYVASIVLYFAIIVSVVAICSIIHSPIPIIKNAMINNKANSQLLTIYFKKTDNPGFNYQYGENCYIVIEDGLKKRSVSSKMNLTCIAIIFKDGNQCRLITKASLMISHPLVIRDTKVYEDRNLFSQIFRK